MKSHPRLARLESALSPKQMVVLEIQSMLRHPDFVTAVREEFVHQMSGPTLCDRIEQAVRKAEGKLEPRVLGSRIAGAQREGLFLARLFTECNGSMLQHLREWELETALVHTIAAMRAGASRRGTPLAALDEVVIAVERLRDSYRAQLRAADLVGHQYFDGMEICFSGTRGRVQELIDQLDCLVKAHRNSGKRAGGPQRATRDERAMSERIDKLACEVAGRWVTFVRAQVHADLGESSKAETLAIKLLRVS